MKYIKFEYAGLVIFKETITHSDMAKRFSDDKPVSAGKVSWYQSLVDGPYCHGESKTLGLRADKTDTCMLQAMLSSY